MEKALVILANGFEEIEAITILDVLRRAKISTTAAGLSLLSVTGAHGITVQADALLDEINADDYEMIVLPGGQPGTRHLGQSEQVVALLQKFASTGKHVAAICAAPMVLAQAGLLNGVQAVCYPGCERNMGQAMVVEQDLCQVDKRITGRGPAVALAFALQLVEVLAGEKVRAEVAADLLYLG